MNQLSEREIRDQLTPKEAPAPPAGLAERIKNEIPEHLEAAPGGDAARFGRRSPLRTYLLAAAVLVAIGGAFLVYRVQEEMVQEEMAQKERAPRDAPSFESSVKAEDAAPRDATALRLKAGAEAEDALPSSAPEAGAGSYAVVRRYLRDGRLPPPEAVRVAELVDAFDYGEAPPRRGGFAIAAEGAPSPFGHGERSYLLRFHLRARDPERLTGRPRVQAELNPEVVSRYRLVGAESRETVAERLGGIGAGHAVTVLYELELHDPPGRRDEVAMLRLRYGSAASESVEIERRVTGEDFARSWDDASPALRLTGLVAAFGEILEGTRTGDLDELFRHARMLAAELPGDAEVAELASLIGRAAEHRR